ncbi:hypothetical protein K469DRAFT_718739 [Zopfia rhizophila CBS 207.26]|uniref:Uncharacterized protein n=1 Tax=Zopfia rhizophila CBS 207.26 TaxID=1314779 RepID=A0A6A6ELR6_9PEZI|nr:hypothetical protein K469DRAFT_718739 [Zopfia rhizophila CBS 207.26]
MFHQDRVNRLPEQTQRRVHGCATSARRRGGGVKKISLGGNLRPEAISGSGLLFQRCLAAWVSGYRDFGHPYRRIMSPFCLEDRA